MNSADQVEIDIIEGLDADEDSSFGEYPIDTVLIRNENRTVFDVIRRIEKGAFIMDPDFQRDFIWPLEKQSKLIESVLMRIPLPVFYLAEDTSGKMIVVDGLQRLSTFKSFIRNEFKLKLPEQPELDRKSFEDLSPKLQNRIEDCNLILYVIDAKVPAQALLDIFDRVNSGIPLSKQQMRNCLYQGPATRFLRDEAKTDLFLQVTGRSLKTESMRDREFINRFCAFYLLPRNEYKGDMNDFLAEALKKLNKLNQEEMKKLSGKFRNSLRNNYMLFGKHSFRKHYKGQLGRSTFNASLWDVMSCSLADISEQVVEAKKENILDDFYDLLEDREFLDSITLGTNQVNRVFHRFNAINNMLESAIND